jgi:hypothetical protein
MKVELSNQPGAIPKSSAVIEWGSWGKNKLKRVQIVWDWVIFTRSMATSDATLGELVSAAHVEETPMSNKITTNKLFGEIDNLVGVGVGATREVASGEN